MNEGQVFLAGLFVFTAITVAIAFLVGPDWMNWGGWGWVSMPWAIWNGACFGWSIRGSHERNRQWLEDLARRSAQAAQGRKPD